MFACLGAVWLPLAYQLGAQWAVYPQYNYGWAVPVLCVFFAWRRGLDRAPREAPAHRGAALRLAGAALAVFPAVRLVHEANPIWRLTSWAWALWALGMTLTMLYLNGGRAWVGHFGFAAAFFLVAVPWPSAFEHAVVQKLSAADVTVAVELVNALGYPALQQGNAIEVRSGLVGIDEACSGMRSVQAALMLALMFGEYFRLRASRRWMLGAAGVALAFVFNVARTSLLTWVAARGGRISGSAWHDGGGTVLLLGCFCGIWCVALWLRGVEGALAGREPDRGREREKADRDGAARASGIFAGLVIACVVVSEAGTEAWYRAHERPAAAAAEWRVDLDAAGLGSARVETAAEVLAQFQARESVQAMWRDDTGNRWQLYYFRWPPGRGLRARVAAQLAKTHGPEKCLPAIGMRLQADGGRIEVSAAGLRFELQQFLFRTVDGRALHVFYGIYEDATGPGVAANRRGDSRSRLRAAWCGSRNYGQRFIEMAVAGPVDADEARMALEEMLRKVVR